MQAIDLLREALAIDEARKHPLPANVIEITARCETMEVWGVDEIGPHYLIRLMQVAIPGQGTLLMDWTIVPEGCFCCLEFDPAPVTAIHRSPFRTILLGFHRDADLSKLRIRLLIDGVPYEVNGAAPAEMLQVKELPPGTRVLGPGC